MRETSKDNEWYFWIKVHIGVDDALGLIHSIDTNAANVHDIMWLLASYCMVKSTESLAMPVTFVFKSGVRLSTVRTSLG